MKIFALSASVANQGESFDQSSQQSPETLFRNYSLAVCLADGYASSKVKIDASAVASGYLEKGSYPLEAYNDAREVGRTFLAKNYPGITDAKLTLMKCIDFSQSPELESVMRKFRKSKGR